MSKYNILFVSATSEIGGADISLLDIIRKINKDRFNPIVLLPFGGPLIGDFRKAGAQVIIANTGYIRRYANPFKLIFNLIRIILSVPGIACILKQKKINFVHSNSSIVFGGALAAKLMGVRHIWHVREIKTSPRFITDFIKRTILFTSDRVIAISAAVQKSFPRDHKSQSKISVIYDGIDLAYFSSRDKNNSLKNSLSIGASSKVIGATGLILPLKGYEYFLEAAKMVTEAYPDSVFLIVGDTVIKRHDNYKESLRKLAGRLGISDKVIFTGMRMDIPEIISLMDISVLASVEPEGMGRVIVESMAMGKPVITTALGGQAEIVRNNIDGIVVPPRDSRALANAILELLDKPDKAKLFGEEGRRKVIKHFDLNKSVHEFENILEEIISIPGKNSR